MLEQQDSQQQSIEPTASPQEAEAIATLAYAYGYPLVVMDVSRDVMTAVPTIEAKKVPVNQFLHMAEFPDDTFKDVVSPNVDTLYSSAWLDLAPEPMVLRVPDTGRRYYLMPMLDAWTNVFASPGTRTTGNGAGAFALVGPNWKGTLPEGVQEIKAPTNLVWIIGRTYTAGKKDYAAVHALQKQYELLPLSAWGRSYTPPAKVSVTPGIDTRTPPGDQVTKMEPGAFFAKLAKLMAANPPAEDDAPLLKRLRMLGIAPGTPFDLGRASPALKTAVVNGVASARARLAEAARAPQVKLVNGWRMELGLGSYGTDYPLRALVTLIGLGANLPEDAVYPMANVDGDGKQLSGANRYVIHFAADALPPANAFWSLTMYDEDQFLVRNPLNRFAIGDRDSLKFNADKSLDIYVQNDDPGPDKQANWLPAPKQAFNVILRVYHPKAAVLDGSWAPPAIVRTKAS
jgi:hypothetical protein